MREEGLNARTTAFDDPVEPYRNGAAYIECCMLTHKPIDLLVIMLGTNDLKKHLHQTAFSSSKGLELVIQRAQKPEYGIEGKPPKILVVSPVHVAPNIEQTWLGEYIDLCGREIGLQLADYYKKMAGLYGCAFLDAADFAEASPADALHMGRDSHKSLAHALAEKIEGMLGE